MNIIAIWNLHIIKEKDEEIKYKCTCIFYILEIFQTKHKLRSRSSHVFVKLIHLSMSRMFCQLLSNNLDRFCSQLHNLTKKNPQSSVLCISLKKSKNTNLETMNKQQNYLSCFSLSNFYLL